ncbi:MAG: DUF29 domain-containing protein [Cyanobacteria bacterium J06634_6]
MSSAYSTDFDIWTDQTAQLLREGRWTEIDTEHLIEEVEDLGKRDRRAVVSQLIRLILHLLKWQHQPERRSDSWLDSITDARVQIELAFEDSPSLKNDLSEQVDTCYRRACRQADQQTGLDVSIFPAACPYELSQCLAGDWLPSE